MIFAEHPSDLLFVIGVVQEFSLQESVLPFLTEVPRSFSDLIGILRRPADKQEV